MIDSDRLLFVVWERVALTGFILVIVGVVIEGVEHFRKFTKRQQAHQKHIERIGWLILVAGLALEFLGDQSAKRLSEIEKAALNQKAGDAILKAMLTESNNFVLRSNVAVLEAKIQPRVVTEDMRGKFLESIKLIPKCDVEVRYDASGGSEPMEYAAQIITLLKDGGYSPQIIPSLGVSVKGAVYIWSSFSTNSNGEFSYTLPAEAAALATSLQSSGIISGVQYQPRVATNKLTLFIGFKD